MSETNYTTETAVLAVEGTLWCGQPDTYHEYPLPVLSDHPETLADAKRIAGDFAELDSAKIILTKRHVREVTDEIEL